MEAQDLKKAGLKITLPRMRILQILEEEQGHFTAEDIYRKILDSGTEFGLATVYRVLTQFETAGLVSRHHFEGGQAVFELNRGSHHDHMVCVKCGDVVEFVDDVIEERQKAVAKEHSYDIQDHSLILYGICSKPECRGKKGG